MDLEKIFEKHDIGSDAQEDLKKAFEKMIIKAFYKEVSKPAKKKETVEDESREGLCKGVSYKGTSKEKPCTSKAKENGFCGRHNPDKETKTSSKTKKKAAAHDCNAIIKKTKKQCSSPGTTQPEGADFWYCGRHSENWQKFEEPAKIEEDEE